MECPTDKIMQEDLESLVERLPFDSLAGRTVLITGATGLIGAQLVKLFACCNRLRQTDIRIIAVVRDREKAANVLGELIRNRELTVLEKDIRYLADVGDSVDYIIHGASATDSQYFVSHPVETIRVALQGTQNMLDLARKKHVRGMVYLSSMEVFGVPYSKEKLKEHEYGYIDILKTRSSYSESKRMAECLCAAYAHEYQVPVKIARLTQTFGPGVRYSDNRVFAQFGRSVLEGSDIVLHSKGTTRRSYCYTADALSAILLILEAGENGTAYTVANEATSITIAEMAEMVASKIADNNIKVVFDLPKDDETYGYAPAMQIRLQTERLEKLGWSPRFDLEDMFRRMIISMGESHGKEPVIE